jgi:hypothetical protein
MKWFVKRLLWFYLLLAAYILFGHRLVDALL